MSTNFDYKNIQVNKTNFELYTIDSDFMVRIWDLSYNEVQTSTFDSVFNQSTSSKQNSYAQLPITNPGKQTAFMKMQEAQSAGTCKTSIMIKPCERYEHLKSKADVFKDELARGEETKGALTRKIAASAVLELSSPGATNAGPKSCLISLCDSSGIMQINNLHSGSILMSLSNRDNKL